MKYWMAEWQVLLSLRAFKLVKYYFYCTKFMQMKIMRHCFLLTRRGWDETGFDHEMKLKPR